MSSSSRSRAVLFVLASAVCFGTTGTAQAFGPDDASSASVGLMRIVVGGTLLGLVAWWVASRVPARTPSNGGRLIDLVTVAIGGAAVVAYQPTFFAGTRLNGVAVGAAVTLGSAPVLTGLLEWVVTRVPPPRVWFLGTSCAVVGVVLLGGLLQGAGQQVNAAGLVSSVGAALSYAVYAVATKRLLDGGASPTGAIGRIFATAALLGAPFLLLVDLSWVGTWSGFAMVAWLAVLTVVVAYVLFAIGLQALSASSVSTLTLAEPVTACLLGLVLLDEHLTATGWAGLVILLGGVGVLATRRGVARVS